MLKKLVKYGNSNALVFDKALLELLNITEGSVVKIKTDGVSLIITPQDAVSAERLVPTITPQESLQGAINQTLAKQCNSEADGQAYVQEMQKLVARYKDTVAKIDSPEVKAAYQEVEKRFGGNRLDPQYGKAMLAVGQKFMPELAQMDAEAKALSEKYTLQKDELKGGFAHGMLDFKKVHEKYQHLHEQLAALNNNPDYIHEMVLLAEKYQATQNSPEYIAAYTQLIGKYIPEYIVYQDELKAVGEKLK